MLLWVYLMMEAGFFFTEASDEADFFFDDEFEEDIEEVFYTLFYMK